MAPPAHFGKRGLARPPPTPPPRRMRSNVVVVGAVGLMAAGVTASAGYQEYRCQPPKVGQVDERPSWCRGGSYSHGYSGGHSSGWGFSSGHSSGGSSHASFGGFGAHGSGHGGGS